MMLRVYCNLTLTLPRGYTCYSYFNHISITLVEVQFVTKRRFISSLSVYIVLVFHSFSLLKSSSYHENVPLHKQSLIIPVCSKHFDEVESMLRWTRIKIVGWKNREEKKD